MTERSMPVPEGLAGMRVDAGLARLLGLSRTAAAAVAEDGGVQIDGVRVGKSDRLIAGALLIVQLPEAPAPVCAAADHIRATFEAFQQDGSL